MRTSVTFDWTLRESARAKIRVIVKRILNKYGYLPDLQEEAVKTVLMQSELLCADWAVAQAVLPLSRHVLVKERFEGCAPWTIHSRCLMSECAHPQRTQRTRQ